MQQNTPGSRRRTRKITRRVKHESTFEYPPDATTKPKTSRYTQFLPQKKVLLLLVLVLLFLGAFSIRALYITVPKSDFHIARQYHSANIARGLYYETLDTIPESQKEVARINAENEAVFEPQIMEQLAYFSYRIVGGDHLWIPQLMSAVFWLLGGAFLYLIARKIMSIDAAVVSTVFYLFVPFAVPASSSFQPDPMMVMMMLASIFMILRHHESPSIYLLLLAATVSSLAIFVKIYCVFPIFGAFLALAVFRQGFKKILISPQVIIFLVVSLVPTAIYMYYGYFVAGFLQGSGQTRFMPNLFLNWSYWMGWLSHIGLIFYWIAILLIVFIFVRIVNRQYSRNLLIVLFLGYIFIMVAFMVTSQSPVYAMLGFTVIAIAIYSIRLFESSSSRALMMGLWLGYLCFGLIFNYHIHTHDYYHLLLIPIIALSLGPIFGIVMNRISEMTSTVYRRAAAWISLVLVITIISLLGIGITGASGSSYYQNQIKIAEEIGDYVGHSTNTVFLGNYYGRVLRYHGELYGLNWPHDYDFRQYELQGRPYVTTEERFNSILERSPDYFIVTDLAEFQEQNDLKGLLISKFPEVDNSEEYYIFDLRETVDLETPFEN